MYPEDVEYLESLKDMVVHRKNWDYEMIRREYKQKLEGLNK
jgi:hypothetical protein